MYIQAHVKGERYSERRKTKDMDNERPESNSAPHQGRARGSAEGFAVQSTEVYGGGKDVTDVEASFHCKHRTRQQREPRTWTGNGFVST